MMKAFLILLCVIESCIINALPTKAIKNHDFLKRKARSTDGTIGCMEMVAKPGEYTFTADGSGQVCGLYVISPPEQVVELEFVDFDIPCETSLIALVDGWEMNGEFFPSPEDHHRSLEERYHQYCGLNKPSKVYMASQNVALIQHLITVAGQGFKVKVKFANTPQPCNVVSSTESGIHTLKNYGSRRNCSISIIYPETVELASVDVGVTSKETVVVADYGISSKCVTSHGADFVQVMGGNSFELSAKENTGIICGLKSNTGSLGTVVGCQHSVVRLVSSGNFYNTVTFSYRPPMQEELSMSSGVC